MHELISTRAASFSRLALPQGAIIRQRDVMVLEKLRSWLERIGISLSSSAQRFEIRHSTLTVNHDGASQTFDVTGGMNQALEAQLGKLGLSAAQAQALIQLSRHPASGAGRHLTLTSEQTVNLGARHAKQTAPELVSSQAPLSTPLDSGSVTRTSELTLEVNGEKRTYDTSSGISEQLKEQLAKEIGISVAELARLLATGSFQQAAVSSVRPPSGGRQMVLCSRCGHQVLNSRHCVYCGEQLSGQNSMASDGSQRETT